MSQGNYHIILMSLKSAQTENKGKWRKWFIRTSKKYEVKNRAFVSIEIIIAHLSLNSEYEELWSFPSLMGIFVLFSCLLDDCPFPFPSPWFSRVRSNSPSFCCFWFECEACWVVLLIEAPAFVLGCEHVFGTSFAVLLLVPPTFVLGCEDVFGTSSEPSTDN